MAGPRRVLNKQRLRCLLQQRLLRAAPPGHRSPGGALQLAHWQQGAHEEGPCRADGWPRKQLLPQLLLLLLQPLVRLRLLRGLQCSNRKLRHRREPMPRQTPVVTLL